jgi:hypothetical protein
MAARLVRRPKDEYERAVANSISAAGALRLLGLRPIGGNYAVLRGRIQEHRISTAPAVEYLNGTGVRWLLCPNCHSQTPTYCGRNKGRRRSVD